MYHFSITLSSHQGVQPGLGLQVSLGLSSQHLPCCSCLCLKPCLCHLLSRGKGKIVDIVTIHTACNNSFTTKVEHCKRKITGKRKASRNFLFKTYKTMRQSICIFMTHHLHQTDWKNILSFKRYIRKTWKFSGYQLLALSAICRSLSTCNFLKQCFKVSNSSRKWYIRK